MKKILIYLLCFLVLQKSSGQSRGFLSFSAGLSGIPPNALIKQPSKSYQGVALEYGRTFDLKGKFIKSFSTSFYYQYFKITQNFRSSFFNGQVIQTAMITTGNNSLGLKLEANKSISKKTDIIASLGGGFFSLGMLGLGTGGENSDGDTINGKITEFTQTSVSNNPDAVFKKVYFNGIASVGVQYQLAQKLFLQFRFQYFILNYPTFPMDVDLTATNTKTGTNFIRTRYELNANPFLFALGFRYDLK